MLVAFSKWEPRNPPWTECIDQVGWEKQLGCERYSYYHHVLPAVGAIPPAQREVTDSPPTVALMLLGLVARQAQNTVKTQEKKLGLADVYSQENSTLACSRSCLGRNSLNAAEVLVSFQSPSASSQT